MSARSRRRVRGRGRVLNGLDSGLSAMGRAAYIGYVSVLVMWLVGWYVFGGIGVVVMIRSGNGVGEALSLLGSVLGLTWLLPPVFPLLRRARRNGGLDEWLSVEAAELRAVTLNVPFIAFEAVFMWVMAGDLASGEFSRAIARADAGERVTIPLVFGIVIGLPILVTLWSAIQKHSAEREDVSDEVDTEMEKIFDQFRSAEITQEGYVALCPSCGDVTVLDLGRSCPCPSCHAVVSLADRKAA